MTKKNTKKSISLKQKNKQEKNYRIFRVDTSNKKRILPKKITMVRIYAKDDNDAYDQLKDYVKIANKEYKYYVEKWSPTIIIRNGKKHKYDDYFEQMEAERKMRPWWKKTFDAIELEFWYWFVRKPQDFYYFWRDLIYLVKNKQQYHTSWCIDDVLLETLKFNLPILKKYKHTLSWAMLEEAWLEKNPKLKKEDAKKFFETNYSGYGKDLENRSIELEHEMFDELVEDIKAYKYYMGDYEFIDEKDAELVETDKKLRHTLPLIKGSYDRYDYKKLNALAEKHWNRIWETVRMYGREFND